MDAQQRIEMIVPRLDGWCTVEKALHLMNLIAKYRPQQIVEIGVFGGRSFLPLVIAADAVECGECIAIDPWDPAASLEGMRDPANIGYWGSLNHEAIYQNFMAALRNYLKPSEMKRVSIFRERSDKAIAYFADHSIDFLHQDGNHSEDVSLAEAKLWLPKLKKKAIWVFDDIDWETTGQAVAFIKENCKVISEQKTYGVYQYV